ncbi:hypothetical protein CDAR_297041 [Caerostris darwini]|uniref:Uncharacterized protein n=1 Tax=Caerostris darwini TaxID=1538125 RepID=A0AAV4QF24_9ARAC|nr:hypothetical protein CDAR_297041 [Caerostris darwini]
MAEHKSRTEALLSLSRQLAGRPPEFSVCGGPKLIQGPVCGLDAQRTRSSAQSTLVFTSIRGHMSSTYTSNSKQPDTAPWGKPVYSALKPDCALS